MKFWTVAIIFLKVISGNSEQQNFNVEIYEVAKAVSGKYFQVFKCVTLITDRTDGIDLKEDLPTLLINLAVQNESCTREKLLLESFENGCGGYVIRTDGKTRYQLVQKLIDARNEALGHRYNHQRYLFLPDGENDTDWNFLTHPGMFYLPNVLFILPTSASYLIITHTLFNSYKHDVLGEEYEVTGSWSPQAGFSDDKDLYPDRISDVHGKKIIFALMHYTPYSLVIKRHNDTIFDGLETRIAAEFVRSINGTWDALDHPTEMWGTKFPNGSGTGIYGSVQSLYFLSEHFADLGYSAIYQWYCDVLDCSYPYIQPEVICLVPKPQVLSGWLTILLPFTVSTWIGLSAAFLISSLFVFGLILAQNHLKGNSNSGHFISTAFLAMYNVFRLQLQQTTRMSHMNNPLGVYIKVSMFYYFIVAVFWQGGIASILTVPRYEKPINTALDLVSKWPKVKWGAVHDVWIHSIENSTEPVLYNIVKNFVILDNDTLVRKTRTRDFGFFIEMLPYGHYGFNDYINEETIPYLRLMEHSIYKAFGVIILPRGSPYTEKLNDLVHWMFATGIVQKMEIQVSLERINNHLQSMIRLSNRKESGKVTLGLRHIEGPAYIYFVGISLSIITLLVEKFLFWRKERSNQLKTFKGSTSCI